MVVTEGLSIFYMKRMLRNLKYLFPENIEEINPDHIKEILLSSRVKKTENTTIELQQINEDPLEEMYIEDSGEKIEEQTKNKDSDNLQSDE